MATAFPQPASAPRQDESGSKRTLWIWLVIGLAALFAFGLWECGSTVYQTFHAGWTEATAADHHFHEELNAEQYEQIYEEASPAFHVPEKHDRLVKFLTVVHQKLGNATSEQLTNINIQVNANGHFITATYTATFENGSADETIVWKRDGNTLRLDNYNINSDALVLN
jgi:Protein of unknown function (DUF4019)